MSSDSLMPFDDLIQAGDTNETKLTVFVGNNLGHRTLLTKVPVFELFRISQVANERGENGTPVTQRKLDPKHAKGLAVYILRGLVDAVITEKASRGEQVSPAHERIQRSLGKQPYMSMQPVVANLRTAGAGGKNLRGEPLRTVLGDTVGFRFWLSQRDILWIVDGQHRRSGLDMMFGFLDEIRLQQKYPQRKHSLYEYEDESREVSADDLTVWLECAEVARGVCTISIEVHLGLTVEEERQLFHDLNRLAKKVDANLALEFDMSNPINGFIKEELVERRDISIETKDNDWEEDTGSFSRKELVAINAILFLNKTNINGATPGQVDEKGGVARRFWDVVTQIPEFGTHGAKTKTVANQPVVLKALAKLTYDYAFGRQANAAMLNQLLDRVSEIDFSHSNPMWRYFDLPSNERETMLPGLAEYLPSDDEGKNRDVGHFDTIKRWMRYGAKHNDIYPIIGDMIRWSIKLPSRHG